MQQERPASLRHSLAARITALVIVVLIAAGVSAVVVLGQLRALQAGFDRLTGVYVVFNQRLAEAHVQAVRVHEIVRTQRNQTDAIGLERSDPAFLGNFEVALRARNTRIADARESIDDALADPDRYGGAEKLEDLRGIQASLSELEDLAALDEMVDPNQVLVDVHTQAQITQLFRSLSTQSSDGIDVLRTEVQKTQGRTTLVTLGLTATTTILGLLATIGVFFTLRPLRQLAAKVRILGRGDWAQRVDVRGSRRDDEVGQLANEFNQMAAALEERERRLLRGERLAAAGQLAAQITHELRNPLSSVALNAELLEDEIRDGTPESKHLLTQITKEVDRLTAVTDDYLRFARRPTPEKSKINLADELTSLVEFMTPELDAAQIEFDLELPDEPAWVVADAGQMRQVFMNLIRNAQEAALDEEADSAQGPRIEVRMRCKGDTVLVVVSDSGPGIDLPANQMDRIFEAFYTRKAQGTGLGLPTVQQILGDHGGSVSVAETGPSGTSFEVAVPACAPQASSVSSEPADAPSQD